MFSLPPEESEGAFHTHQSFRWNDFTFFRAFALINAEAIMFTPKLVLIPESDGEFTLLGEIETPNSCYVVREISREEPRQHPLPKHWHSFVLRLDIEKGPCNPVKSTLRVRLPDLQIHNGETVVLFVMNGKEVLGWDRLTLADGWKRHSPGAGT